MCGLEAVNNTRTRPPRLCYGTTDALELRGVIMRRSQKHIIPLARMLDWSEPIRMLETGRLPCFKSPHITGKVFSCVRAADWAARLASFLGHLWS